MIENIGRDQVRFTPEDFASAVRQNEGKKVIVYDRAWFTSKKRFALENAFCNGRIPVSTDLPQTSVESLANSRIGQAVQNLIRKPR